VDGHVVPSQAEDSIAGELEIRVAGGVPLAVAASAVEFEAVELDGETVLCPEGVNLMRPGLTVNESIEERARDVEVLLEHQLEEPLQLTPLGAGRIGGSRLPQDARPAPPLAAIESVKNRIEVEQPASLCAIDRRREVGRANDGAQIEQRPGDAGYWDAIQDSEVLRLENARAVDMNTFNIPAYLGNRDLWASIGRPDAPQVSGRTVTKNGRRPACHYRRQIAACVGERVESDCVYAPSVQGVQHPGIDPAPDC
jgi:hypothetical protein